jgi:poly(3-hydroxybutyrate) depolymerase
MLYTLYETQRRLLQPFAKMLNQTSKAMDNLETFMPNNMAINLVQAQTEFMYQFTRQYTKPGFNIDSIQIDGKDHPITEETISDNSFCDLKHFSKDIHQEPLLIVAPLSGHYATLLKDTVKSCLKGFDVYITDWKNACEVPLKEGDFGFDDYVQYVIDYIKQVKKIHGKCHVLAVCQPTVPVLTAIAWLEKNEPQSSPTSAILMGGPIDVRQSPTEVNKYALKHDIAWFKSHVLFTVPFYFPGAGRRVYPGFLQHMGFVSMNFAKHTKAQIDFFNDLLIGADLDAKKHKDFYEEYNAVMDLPAKYYIETLERVFIDQHLAKGTMKFKDQIVSLEDIKNVKILSVEGELDDISGPGQTHAVIDLTTNLKRKEKLTAQKVGHYGVFSGRVWREETYPSIEKFILKSFNKTSKATS